LIRALVLFSRKGLRIAAHMLRAERLKGARVDLFYASALGESRDLLSTADLITLCRATTAPIAR